MTIDLHGVKHKDVEKIVEDLIASYQPPFRIITGNSIRMKELVIKVLDQYHLQYFEFGPSIITG